MMKRRKRYLLYLHCRNKGPRPYSRALWDSGGTLGRVPCMGRDTDDGDGGDGGGGSRGEGGGGKR